MKKYYSLVRALHLYFGLFISPFILIFSVSVLVLNHPEFFNKLRQRKELEPVQVHLENFQVKNSDSLTAKSIIQAINVSGEIDWISRTDSTISFPVNNPGLARRIEFNIKTGNLLITQYDEGSFRGTNYLHTMPGPHNARLRGNSYFMKAWRIATDTVVYIVLFLSATGVFLWYFLQPERKLGIGSLAIGFVCFITLLMLLL